MKVWAGTKRTIEVKGPPKKGKNKPSEDLEEGGYKTKGRWLCTGEVCDGGRGPNRVQYALKANEQGYGACFEGTGSHGEVSGGETVPQRGANSIPQRGVRGKGKT